MMREIKFDFIYKGDHQFYHKKYHLDELVSHSLAGLSDIHHQMKLIAKRQYTGLNDSTGRKIYEGDILKVEGNEYYSNDSFCIDEEEWEYIGKVKSNSCMWLIESNNTWLPFCDMLMEDFEIEIIGNIYENPELLEN
jgi:uncharacterized phage protein (TIGR01671 family)